MPRRLGDAAPEIQDGDLFFFRGTALVSRLIRWKSQSRISHVGIALWIGVGNERRLAIIEAMEPGGVRMMPMDRYLEQCADQGVIVDWFAITDPAIDRQKVVQYALGCWGKKYASLRQMIISFGGLVPLIRRWLGWPVVKISKDRFFCSQLAAEAFAAGGYQAEEDSITTDPGEASWFTCITRRGSLTV